MPQAIGGGSSGSGTFSSSPTNQQLPAYTGLAPGVASGLSNAFNLGPNGISAPGGAISPFMVNGISSGSTANPLSAQLTGAQTGTLTNVGNFGTELSSTLSPAFSAVNNFLSPNFAASLASSPQTKSAVTSALQPIQQQFRSQTVPGLEGSSTQSGQRVQGSGGEGSSAFDQAFATAQGNEQATEAATAGSLVNAAYQTGLNIEANAPAQLTGLSSGEISNLINTLNAQALPQLTQQNGITQGLSLYQNQLSTLLQALGLGGQVSQPAIAYNSTGENQSSSSPGLLSAFTGGANSPIQGLSTAFGGLFSGGNQDFSGGSTGAVGGSAFL